LELGQTRVGARLSLYLTKLRGAWLCLILTKLRKAQLSLTKKRGRKGEERKKGNSVGLWPN